MSSSSLSEVFEFLEHERPDVRKMAADSLAGISTDQKIVAELADHPAFLQALVRHLDDQPAVALGAWKTLINASGREERIGTVLSEQVDRIVAKILDREPSNPFRDFACMLLANLCKASACQEATVAHLNSLLALFVGPTRTEQGTPKFDFLGSVLAEVSQTRSGRAALAEKPSKLLSIAGQIASPSIIRRGGALATIKNCLFDPERHEALLQADDEEEVLLGNLASLLVCPETAFSQEELDEMMIDVQLEHRHAPAEPDMVLRTLAIESLILLGTTRGGRDVLRAKKIYPIVREWHKVEPEEAIKELLEKVVEYLIRDEEEMVEK